MVLYLAKHELEHPRGNSLKTRSRSLLAIPYKGLHGSKLEQDARINQSENGDCRALAVIVQDIYPELVSFGNFGTPNKIFRISLSSAKKKEVCLFILSYLTLKLTHFHWIYHVITQFTPFLGILGLFRAYLSAPRGSLLSFEALRPLKCKLKVI
jgi:hypothetical protein